MNRSFTILLDNLNVNFSVSKINLGFSLEDIKKNIRFIWHYMSRNLISEKKR